MNKTLRTTINITLVIMAVMVGLVIISTVWNAILTSAEKQAYPPPGTMVSVNDNQMHVYSVGSGEKKIVLLSGFGNSCPVLSFKYLAEDLSLDYSIIVVEYFGYGWSGITNAPRTVSNIVDETRQALKLAGFAPPYVLMPHSASGIYALYYANTYPDDVEAIIGMESSTPAQIPLIENLLKDNDSIYAPGSQGAFVWKFLRFSGLRRLAIRLFPNRYAAPWIDSYSDADMALLDVMYLWNYGNPNLIDEGDRFLENLKAVRNMTIPTDIPTAFILADSSININRELNGLDWEKMHQDQLPGNVYGKVVILEGEHYIYYDHIDQIKSVVDGLLTSQSK